MKKRYRKIVSKNVGMGRLLTLFFFFWLAFIRGIWNLFLLEITMLKREII